MSRITIVVDQPTTLMLLAKLSSQLDIGIEVKAFSDPLEAILDFQKNKPDLMIVESRLKSIDGAEVIRRFRAIPGFQFISAVAIITPEDAEFRKIDRSLGVTDFLMLPLDYDEFRSRMRYLLRRSGSGEGLWFDVWDIW